MIKVQYSSVDRFRETRSFKTLKGARKYAQQWIGKNPEMGSTYAVAGDGIGKIMVEGVALAELFGEEKSIAQTLAQMGYGARRRLLSEITQNMNERADSSQDMTEIAAFIKSQLGGDADQVVAAHAVEQEK